MSTTTIEQTTLTKEQREVIAAPKFRNPNELSIEQLTDPDYSLKQLMKQNGAHSVTCSKCHHCR